ncbi:MAG TPA: hypothetical protein VGC86_03150 [Afipia sp.]
MRKFVVVATIALSCGGLWAVPAAAGCQSGVAGANSALSDPACQATANGISATAVGVGATANQDLATAYGFNSTANGASSSAYGDRSRATGSGSTATGFSSTASGVFSTASGNSSSAYGDTSIASGERSTALGAGTTAAFANSTAIGNGAATTAVNQIAVGTASNTYRLAGITSAASLAAQSGPTSLVTTDAAGNLAAASFSGQDVSVLQSQVGTLQTQMRQGFEGTAIAIAMGGSALPSDKKFAISSN